MRDLIIAARSALTVRRASFKGQGLLKTLFGRSKPRALRFTPEQKMLMAEVNRFIIQNNFELYREQSLSVVRYVQEVDAYLKSQNDGYHAQPIMVRCGAKEGNLDILVHARIGDPDKFDNHFIVLTKVKDGCADVPQKKKIAEFVAMIRESGMDAERNHTQSLTSPAQISVLAV